MLEFSALWRMTSLCPCYESCPVAFGKCSPCERFSVASSSVQMKQEATKRYQQEAWESLRDSRIVASPSVACLGEAILPQFCIIIFLICFCLVGWFNPSSTRLHWAVEKLRTILISWFLWIWCKFLWIKRFPGRPQATPYRGNDFLKRSRWSSVSLLILLPSICWLGIFMGWNNLVWFIKSFCHSQCLDSHLLTK